MNDFCKGVVSIVTPVYNGERYIYRLMDSILSQTYPYIRMLVVDDGSTDNSLELLKQYQTMFVRKGYILEIVSQPNNGASSALNTGLKYVNGEYLIWPDSDDWFASNSIIENFVSLLKGTDDSVGLVRCSMNIVNERTLQIEKRLHVSPIGVANIFCDSLVWKDGVYGNPGAWMVKTKFLDDLIPKREIFHSKRAGQNAQLLWPYLYNKDCVSIDEPWFNYLVRENSHSRNMYKGIKNKIDWEIEHRNAYVSTLMTMPGLSLKEREQYILLQEERCYSHVCSLYYQDKDIKSFRKCYKSWKNIQRHFLIPIKIRILYYLSYIPGCFHILSFLKGRNR